jgi:hypothetical protein
MGRGGGSVRRCRGDAGCAGVRLEQAEKLPGDDTVRREVGDAVDELDDGGRPGRFLGKRWGGIRCERE